MDKCKHDWEVKGWTWCTCRKCGKHEPHPDICSSYWSKIFSRYDGTGLITPDLQEKLNAKGVNVTKTVLVRPVIIESNSGAMIEKGSFHRGMLWILWIALALSTLFLSIEVIKKI